MNSTRRIPALLQVARACAVLPLLAGGAIFILWLLTRSILLMFAGMITIYAGLASVSLGLALLLTAWWLVRRRDRKWRRYCWRSSLVTVALIVLCFPMAAGLTWSALTIESCSKVTVSNRTGQDLLDVHITGGGCDRELGTIAPGRSVSTWFWIKTDGVLLLQATQGSQRHEETLVNYVSRDCGGTSRAVFQADGEIRVHHRDAFGL